MTTVNIAYANAVNITMDLSALAASSTFVAGRESTQVDNTSNKYIDALVRGRFIVGTTPTLPCQFNVYLWGAAVSLATTAIDVLDGTDSAIASEVPARRSAKNRLRVEARHRRAHHEAPARSRPSGR
mgnify:CR=1 FL=1